MASVVLALGLAAPSPALSGVVAGEAVRVDLGQRALVVKVAGRAPRELEFAVDDGTRFTAGGRAVRLEDVRPGERVVVAGTEAESGRRRARLVRAGASRTALAPPAPPPSGP